MNGHGEKLTRKQEEAIAALLGSFTVEEASKLIGVSARTLARWIQLPEFKAEYRAARLAVVEGTINELVHLCGKAVAALKKNLTCGAPAAENRAAELVLSHASKGLELADLARRVDELEALYNVDHRGLDNPPGETLPPTADAGGAGESTAIAS